MDVWIEMSIPNRGIHDGLVTSFMDVWIEIPRKRNDLFELKSHPLWMCGLKYEDRAEKGMTALSHPIWMCC